jgi:predicted DsbA family dithiol-disulfide isomerase
MSELEKEFDLEVEWRGYVIHIDGKKSRYREPGYVSSKWKILGELAEEMGKTVAQPTFVPDTGPALEAGEFAKDHNVFHRFHDLVFAAYFGQGRDIGDPNALREIVEAAGLDSGEFQHRSESGEFKERLSEYRKIAQENAINAFPTFLFDGLTLQHFRIVGAHPYATMKLHLENYLKRRNKILDGLN